VKLTQYVYHVIYRSDFSVKIKGCSYKLCKTKKTVAQNLLCFISHVTMHI